VPVPEVINGEMGQVFLAEDRGNTKVFLIVTDFFEGDTLEKPGITLDDIKTVTSYLRKINSIKLEVAENYDSWGARNFAAEFGKKQQYLSPEHKGPVKQALKEFEKLDFSRYPKSLIHGDIQRKHVLKNHRGDYVLLDFGCANFDPRVLDPAIFLATFCFDEKSWTIRSDIIETLRYNYFEPLRFTERELQALPALVKATYASYMLNASYLQNKQGDESEQTANWLNFSSKMLELLLDWQKLF